MGLCLSSCESSSIASMAVDLFERDPRNEPPSWRVLDKKLLTLLLLLCRVVRDVGGSYKWYNHGWESETFAFSHSSILTALIWFSGVDFEQREFPVAAFEITRTNMEMITPFLISSACQSNYRAADLLEHEGKVLLRLLLMRLDLSPATLSIKKCPLRNTIRKMSHHHRIGRTEKAY